MRVWVVLFRVFTIFTTIMKTSQGISPITSSPSAAIATKSTPDNNKESLLVVFSDVDGTLVHYPKSMDSIQETETEEYPILKLPPSSTGMRGIISHTTLQRCREIRKSGTKLVLVSGMRTSTLIKRLPFLPKADAYCSEAGGRIFYPAEVDKVESSSDTLITIQPEVYNDANIYDLKPFSLREDAEWRQQMLSDNLIGKNAFEGNQLPMFDGQETSVEERSGLLWSFAADLLQLGFVLDTKGYSTCFRVNRKQQSDKTLFDKLFQGQVKAPDGLASSTNLGCVDFYPMKSGKKNCCEYLSGVLGSHDPGCLKERCVCLCDDDNDIEMASGCAHAFLPEVTSDSMADAIQKNPSQFTKASSSTVRSTKATDRALAMVLERI